MEFARNDFEQDEYVFRVRALLAEEPDGLDLTGLEKAVRNTADRDGGLPKVTDATLRTRVERALLWLVVHEGAEFGDRAGGGKVVRAGRTATGAARATASENPRDTPPGDLIDYRARIRATLEEAPDHKVISGDLKRAVKKSREDARKEWAPLDYADALIVMQNDAELKRQEDGYQLLERPPRPSPSE